jgi:hypothetical protein
MKWQLANFKYDIHQKPQHIFVAETLEPDIEQV